MNYKPVVAWGIQTGGTASSRAVRFASWGLRDAAFPGVERVIGGINELFMTLACSRFKISI
jgi:hypothetical protein